MITQNALYAIPCQWDMNLVDNLLDIASSENVKKSSCVREFYGTISTENIPHGRSSSAVHSISKNKALHIKKRLDDKDFKFSYLLNAPMFEEDFNKYLADLDWIINVFRADALTITSFDFGQFIRKHYPAININISTIAGIKTVSDLTPYLSINPSKVVLHNDANRNFSDLECIVDFAEKNGIEVELMVTESCMRRCKKRKAHYDSISLAQDDFPFHLWCNTIKIENPYHLLLCNFIRPEDITYYQSLGIRYFKITGRSKPLDWLPIVVKAYLCEEFKGNLVRLFGVDPQLHAEKWIYIDNSRLDGFLTNFPKNGSKQDEIHYCKKYIRDLYLNKHFLINHPSVEYIDSSPDLKFKCRENIYNYIKREYN